MLKNVSLASARWCETRGMRLAVSSHSAFFKNLLYFQLVLRVNSSLNFLVLSFPHSNSPASAVQLLAFCMVIACGAETISELYLTKLVYRA